MGTHCHMVCSGEPGDAEEFGEFVAKNVELYNYRHGYPMQPRQVAHFARREIADALRTRVKLPDTFFCF